MPSDFPRPLLPSLSGYDLASSPGWPGETALILASRPIERRPGTRSAGDRLTIQAESTHDIEATMVRLSTRLPLGGDTAISRQAPLLAASFRGQLPFYVSEIDDFDLAGQHPGSSCFPPTVRDEGDLRLDESDLRRGKF